MNVPHGYSVRRPRADEAADVAAIFAAYDLSQFDRLDTSAAEIEEDWARPRFARERDSWVVVAGDRPAAYASNWDEQPHVGFACDGVVPSGARGRQCQRDASHRGLRASGDASGPELRFLREAPHARLT